MTIREKIIIMCIKCGSQKIIFESVQLSVLHSYFYLAYLNLLSVSCSKWRKNIKSYQIKLNPSFYFNSKYICSFFSDFPLFFARTFLSSLPCFHSLWSFFFFQSSFTFRTVTFFLYLYSLQFCPLFLFDWLCIFSPYHCSSFAFSVP